MASVQLTSVAMRVVESLSSVFQLNPSFPLSAYVPLKVSGLVENDGLIEDPWEEWALGA